jgi:hypothetical protein
VARNACILLIAFSFPVLCLPSRSGDKPAPGKKQISKREIDKLIVSLGHADFRIREKAMTQLQEIGEPALEGLYQAEKSGNAEIGQRAKLLIPEIEWRVLPSKTVNGMQFKFVVDKRWSAPRPGEANTIKLRLDAKNIGDTIRRISTGGIQVGLTDGKDKNLLSQSGNLRTKPTPYSPPLKKGQTYCVELKAILNQGPNKLQFSVMDSLTGFYTFDTPSKGYYNITLLYRNLDERAADRSSRLWVGEVAFCDRVEIQ